MKTNTANKIIEYIQQKKQATPKEIIDFVGFGAPAVYRQLKKLQEQHKIEKIGSAPKVFYILNKKKEFSKSFQLETNTENIIEKNFLDITPLGEIFTGTKAFANWCTNRSLNIQKSANEYLKILKKYDSLKKNGLIDGYKKLKNTFSEVFINEMYYLDFYSIEKFGKTKLGKLTLYAKQSQDKQIMKILFEIVKPKIQKIIKEKNIDAIAFVPHTIPRQVQLQKELSKTLNISLPQIKLIKAHRGIPVAQKSLSKLEDRIKNANQSIFIDDSHTYKNVLLIDDAVGSGATLNETARKLKNQKTANYIIGLSLVGSFNGFDVIQEI